MIPEIIAIAATAAAAAGIAGRGIFAPRSNLWGPLVWGGNSSAPARVALTFDDGPHPDATPQTLDLLAKAGARATFFLIGEHAQKWPALVKRIVEEGHLIGNHSLTHAQWGGMHFAGYWEREIARTSELLAEIAGVRTAWYRPPYCVKQWHMHQAVRRTGHVMITYTHRALDGLPTTPAKIVERLVPRAAAGAILALHDGMLPGVRRPAEPTLEALPLVIEGLRARGLAIAPLDELLAAAPYASPAGAKKAPAHSQEKALNA